MSDDGKLRAVLAEQGVVTDRFAERTFDCPNCRDTGFVEAPRIRNGRLVGVNVKCSGGECQFWEKHRKTPAFKGDQQGARASAGDDDERFG